MRIHPPLRRESGVQRVRPTTNSSSSEADGVEAAGKVFDLGLQGGQPRGRVLLQYSAEVHQLLAALLLDFSSDVNGLADELSDLHEVLLHQASGGHGRSANSEAVGVHGALVTWDGVLVQDDRSGLAEDLGLVAVDALASEVHQQKVVVSAVGDQIEALLFQGVAQGLGILENLLLVGLVLRLHRHLQCHSQRRDRLVMWATLEAREHSRIDSLLQVPHDRLSTLIDSTLSLAVEDHRSARAAQGLVGGSGDDVGILEGGGKHAAKNEAGNVGHVCDQVGAALVGDGPHAGVVDEAAVGAGAGNQDLRSDAHGELLALVVVNEACGLIQSVRDRLEELRDHGDLLGLGLEAVGKVTTVGEVQTHDAVMHVAEGGVDLEVRWGAAQGLHVDAPLLWADASSCQSTILAEFFGLVDVFVATVVSGTWIALRILVDHDAADGVQDRFRRKIFGRDEAEAAALTILLTFNDGSNLGVNIRHWVVQFHGLGRDSSANGVQLSVLLSQGCTARDLGAQALHGGYVGQGVPLARSGGHSGRLVEG
mmetsp:Transcript_79311/g.173960  ORF Transcript_79311/g.173960 Transcript_79311/m.173960 type:complete len:538 (-) Transcript_79311:24-1637(-)